MAPRSSLILGCFDMRAQEFVIEGRKQLLSQQQIQDMADLYASGFSTRDIARDYNVHPTSVGKNLSKLPNFAELTQKWRTARQNQGLPTGLKNFTPDQVSQMADLYSQGKTLTEIAKIFNIPTSTVKYLLEKLPNFAELRQNWITARQTQGLTNFSQMTGPKNITPDQVSQMAELYRRGKTLQEIATQFGIHLSAVRWWLMKRPDWPQIQAQNRQNRLPRSRPRPQVTTDRGFNKPGSKGKTAIGTTGPASGGKF
jgi:DNA invertase Pin-like site-specific DNA recombinase